MTDVSEERDRPQVSTRDPEELRVALTGWFARELGPDAAPEVSSFEVPAGNGMSSATVLFDLTTGAAGSRETASYVARFAPEDTAVPVFPSYDFDRQVRVMQLVADHTDVPVPRPHWFEPDAGTGGSSFFVMDRVEGVVPPDVMPYNFGGDNWVYAASPAELARLQGTSIEVLAKLHAIDLESADAGFLELARPEPTALRRHVADQWDYYRWVAGDARQSVIEDCFAWLEEHWPADEGETVLSWGDSRIGNVMYRDFAPVAVLDWEMAGVAPREVDLAWMIFLHRFFEDLAHELELPGMPDFLRCADVVDAYERLSGRAPQNMEFFLMYAALRHGIVMSRVQQRSVFFGEIEAPSDPNDLIMHRRTLEGMLEGSYWSRL
jgi:aminoglycoside phosphotransferase (APT) family kinase protein